MLNLTSLELGRISIRGGSRILISGGGTFLSVQKIMSAVTHITAGAQGSLMGPGSSWGF